MADAFSRTPLAAETSNIAAIVEESWSFLHQCCLRRLHPRPTPIFSPLVKLCSLFPRSFLRRSARTSSQILSQSPMRRRHEGKFSVAPGQTTVMPSPQNIDHAATAMCTPKLLSTRNTSIAWGRSGPPLQNFPKPVRSGRVFPSAVPPEAGQLAHLAINDRPLS